MNNDIKEKQKKSAGFTLLEIMMTIAIILIIFVALGSLITNFSYLSNFIFARVGSQSEMNDVFSRMINELRRATAASDGAYVIQSASTSSLVFFSDVIGDSNTERVRYYYESGALKRGLVVASGTPVVYDTSKETILILVKNITTASSGIFSYYGAGSDVSSTPLTYPLNISDIRVIKINISITETTRGVKSSRNFTTAVTPRSILFQ
ncbi:MAG: prepilin-type N-terminal cleavage/methylation domain-containing protein [bacterium]|nr:prepilin-type N-terminal cleavage/methylation domain-containing protein [bacterium]